MSKPTNKENVEILSFKADPPLFEVVGNPEREDVQELCRTLINYGANPMLWGDRDIPDFIVRAGNGVILIREEGEIKLILSQDLKPGQQILCVQSYRQKLTPQELQIIRRSSLFLYGLESELDELRYSPEQKESMKRRMLSTFNRQVAKQSNQKAGPSTTIGDDVLAKKISKAEHILQAETCLT